LQRRCFRLSGGRPAQDPPDGRAMVVDDSQSADCMPSRRREVLFVHALWIISGNSFSGTGTAKVVLTPRDVYRTPTVCRPRTRLSAMPSWPEYGDRGHRGVCSVNFPSEPIDQRPRRSRPGGSVRALCPWPLAGGSRPRRRWKRLRSSGGDGPVTWLSAAKLTIVSIFSRPGPSTSGPSQIPLHDHVSRKVLHLGQILRKPA
jgi:hypothetical protein